MQVAAQVIGNDSTITWCGANGNFELNVMAPVLAHNILESVRLLANSASVFASRCVAGIIPDKARCGELVERSMSMVTSLSPIIGYDLAAKIAKESAKSGRTIRQICTDEEVLPADQLTDALDPVNMCAPSD